ncbi:hypothetical protein U6Q08_12335, partial [Cutibacterium acnes]
PSPTGQPQSYTPSSNGSKYRRHALAITADPLLAGPMIRALTSTATSASGKKRLVDAASHVINVKLAHSLTK